MAWPRSFEKVSRLNFPNGWDDDLSCGRQVQRIKQAKLRRRIQAILGINERGDLLEACVFNVLQKVTSLRLIAQRIRNHTDGFFQTYPAVLPSPMMGHHTSSSELYSLIRRHNVERPRIDGFRDPVRVPGIIQVNDVDIAFR